MIQPGGGSYTNSSCDDWLSPQCASQTFISGKSFVSPILPSNCSVFPYAEADTPVSKASDNTEAKIRIAFITPCLRKVEPLNIDCSPGFHESHSFASRCRAT